MEMTYNEACTWLRDLHDKIWKKTKVWDSYRHRQVDRFEPIAKLTQEQLDTLRAIADAHPFGWVMQPGLICSIGISAVKLPDYPGAGNEYIAHVHEDHLPFSHRDEKPGGLVWPAAWDFFSQFTHTDINRQRAAQFGFEEPKVRNHYDY